jgi:hypothetical protein
MDIVVSDPTLLRYSWPEISVVVALVGVVALWCRRRPVALLLLGPFVVCMAAVIAHQYPFRGGLVVWLLPSLLLAVARFLCLRFARSRQLSSTIGTYSAIFRNTGARATPSMYCSSSKSERPSMVPGTV